MTSTRASASQGSPDQASPLETRTLRITSLEPAAGIGRHLVELMPTCLPEQPSWFDLAHKSSDGRGLGPLVIRYESKHVDDLFSQRSDQDSIRASIWAHLKKLLHHRSLLPDITFDEGRHTEKGSLGRIDLSFPTSQGFDIVMHHLHEIHVGSSSSSSSSSSNGEQTRVYAIKCFTNSLAGHIFRIDILNLTLDEESELEAFCSSMRHMTANIGQLMGIAKLVITSNDWLPESTGGLHRIYVQLDRPMMSTSLQDLATRLPSHLLWYGVPFKLLYVGCQLRGLAASANYPFALPEARGEGQASAAGERPATSEEDAANSSVTTAAAKRRRAASGA